jgi:hypothetical protein
MFIFNLNVVFREANVRALSVRGSVTRIEFARDTLPFAYFRIRSSVLRLECCAKYCTY